MTKTKDEITQAITDAFEGSDIQDINGGSALQTLIEAVAQQAANNFGQAQQILMAPHVWQSYSKTFGNVGAWVQNPEYEGLPWAFKGNLTKRERKVADLHMLLYKLKVTRDEEDNKWTEEKVIKRLKRVPWAKYIKTDKTV